MQAHSWISFGEETMAKEKRRCWQDKVRPEEERKDLKHRLNRIEGQVRGIQKMVEEDIFCPDIVVQIAAVTSALNSVSRELILSHLDHCVWNDLKAGKKEAADEIIRAFNKLSG